MSSASRSLYLVGLVPGRPLCTSCTAYFTHAAPYSDTAERLGFTYISIREPTANKWRRGYATQRLDVVRLRADVDQRARSGFYQLSRVQGALRLAPDKANAIYKEFLSHKDRRDHGANVRQLAKRYRVNIEDITDLALVTYRIPDLSDPKKRSQLPPSMHKSTAGLILQACAQAGEPLAVVHILTAVYVSSCSSEKAAHEIARMFPRSAIVKYRSKLEELCLNSKTIALGPDALTLKGLFSQMEGERQKAKEAFELAIARSHLAFKKGMRSPLQLPLVTPWNALGYLLRSDKDPAVQAEAKRHFLLGAQKADDPLSCFEASQYEPRTSPDWLQLTSRAAASGHKQAIINLAEFYQEISMNDTPITDHPGMRKALNWLLSWRTGSAAALAQEWHQAASNLGHKPSMLQLADSCESAGDFERAAEHLRRIIEPPTSANQIEEWPQLVKVAQKRLAGIRVRMS